MMKKVAIVGCGLIGAKRSKALGPGAQVAVCCDTVLERALALARSIPGGAAEASSDWRATVARPDIDIVIAATIHDQLAPITAAAVEAGKPEHLSSFHQRIWSRDYGQLGSSNHRFVWLKNPCSGDPRNA